jgi:hypothetical protein
MRPARDRLAELIRTSRLRGAGGEYEFQSDETREDYQRSADWMLANASALGLRIVDERARSA